MSTFKDHDVEAASPQGEVVPSVPALIPYVYTPGSRLKGDAQVVGEELQRITGLHGGQLNHVDPIIEEARSVTSPLHDQFEWDDSIAAQEHRRYQARRLLACIRIVSESSEGPETYRAFVNIQIGVQQSYHTTAEALSDKDLREKILAKALREARAWQDRYSQYHELSKVFEAIQKVNVTV
tara:strand:- start:74 stop:616 length:543 start_codon:yes stop_codon:yes gene_type:complete